MADVRNARGDTIADQFVQKVKLDAGKNLIRRYAPTIVLVVMTVFSMIFVPGFMSVKNLVNMLYQITLPLVLATGLTFVLLIGSIDLSLEGVMAISGSIYSLLVINSLNGNNFGLFAVPIIVIMGTMIGIVTGILHVKFRIASFMVTFAVGTIVRGIGLLSYKTTPATIKDEAIIAFSRGSFLGMPLITYVALAVFLIGCIILNYTAFGRAVYAIGANEYSARAAGINIDRVKIMVFMLCSGAVSIAGILGVIQLKIGSVGIGDGMLFPTIAAVTVGGIAAGRGGMLQTLIGVLIYTELEIYLTLLGVNTFYKQAIQGIIILIAVALSATRDRKRLIK
jgi:ribose transport system permease protein